MILSTTEWIAGCVAILLSCYCHEIGHWIMLRFYGIKSKLVRTRYGIGVEILETKDATLLQYLTVAAMGGLFAALIFAIVYLYIPHIIILFIVIFHIVYAIAETTMEYRMIRADLNENNKED